MPPNCCRDSCRSENQQALVGIIQRQAVHLGRLLDDLLDVARITRAASSCGAK